MTLPIPMATSFTAIPACGPSRALLPGQKRVVDLDRAGPDLDRALDPLRRDADVAIAEAAVEGLGRFVVDADGEPQPVEASRAGLALGGRGQRRRDAAPAVFRAHRDILELGWVGQGEVRMPGRLIALPGDEVEAVALLEPGEAQDRAHPVDLARRQAP